MSVTGILEVNSAFQAVDGETGKQIVNLSRFQAPQAWDKMDAIVEYFTGEGWTIIDHRYDPPSSKDGN